MHDTLYLEHFTYNAVPYDRPLLKELKPVLLTMYLACQVRYLPLNNKFQIENKFSNVKNNFPTG